tara:strand:+ start:63 stop:359 length:297 start_codon:yes stop_codon:yes gene_type:complete
MYQWTPHKLMFIAMNCNISDSDLAGLLGTSKASVQAQRYKIGATKSTGKPFSSFGIPGLKFCKSKATYVVRVKRKSIGNSKNFERAVEILDNYLMGEL